MTVIHHLPKDETSSEHIASNSNPNETAEASEPISPDFQSPGPVNESRKYSRAAWCTLTGAWLTAFTTYGYLNAFGVYQDLYTRSHTASASQVAWIGALQYFFIIALGPISGALLDRGYFKPMMACASALYVFALFMVSIADTSKYWQLLLAQGFAQGITSGFLFIPCLAVQAHHWGDGRALAMAIVSTGTSIGGIVFPILLNALIFSKVGFAWGVRASAFLVLGLQMIGVALMQGPTQQQLATDHNSGKNSLRSVLRDVPYLLLSVGILFGHMAIYFPAYYLQLFAVLHGVNKQFAFYLLAIMSATSIIGRIATNLYANRLGPLNLLIVSTLISGILMFALFGVTSPGSSVAFAAIYGIASGAYNSLIWPAVGRFARHPSEMGTRLGVALMIGAFGGLTGGPIDGALLGTNFTWYKPVVFSAAMAIAGTLLMILSRNMVAKSTQTWVV